MTPGHSFLVHDEADDVGVAVVHVERGSEVVAAFMKSDRHVVLVCRDDIPLGHKVALRDLDEGTAVVKYGTPIGRTMQRVRTGDRVHTHNLRSARW